MGQKLKYPYNGDERVGYIDRYPDGVTWDKCQSVALTYDASGTNVMGRLAVATTGDTTVCAPYLTENYSYTPGGLVAAKGYGVNFPTAWNSDHSIEYLGYGYGPSATFTYDNEGHATGYNAFVYTPDDMGRPTGMTETGPNTAWVQNAAYGPGGELKTMQLRTSSTPYPYYTETHTYNNRAQLTELQTGGTGLTGINLQYAYTSGSNNGQVSQMTDAISGEHVAYTYDSLKRLIKAETTQTGGLQWGQSFGYDGWGNLVSKTPTYQHTGTSMSLTVEAATNHVITSGFAYDANGNTTSIPSTPQNINLTYDVENRTGGTWYDQQNQPLDRAGVWNLYGLRGERLGTFTYSVAWQYQPQGSILVGLATVTTTQVSRNIYFAGRLIQSNGTTVVRGPAGSVRANENGQAFEYYPYGEEVTVQNPQDREKFGTYTRESSTGLDYADQRYYASVYGRFNTPDRYQAETASPGSFNTYSYSASDPINSFDPTGLFAVCLGISAFGDGDFVGTLGEGNCGLIPYLTVAEYDDVHPRPPQCWQDVSRIDQTLTDIGGNVIQIAQKTITDPSQIASLTIAVLGDVSSELTSLEERVGSGLRPLGFGYNNGYYVGGHFNLILPNSDVQTALGGASSSSYKAFADAFAGDVRQDAVYGNPVQGTLHSSDVNNDYFHFHLDTFNPLPGSFDPIVDIVGLLGHFLYDVIGGHIGTPCLDPAWLY